MENRKSSVEMTIEVEVLKDSVYTELTPYIANLIDSTFDGNQDMLDFHKANKAGKYSFGSLLPFKINQEYKAGQICTFRLRTFNKKLLSHLFMFLEDTSNERLRVTRILSVNNLERNETRSLESLTPVIIRVGEGNKYWKDVGFTEEDVRQQIEKNARMKYREIFGKEIPEGTEIFSNIYFKNSVPVLLKVKKAKLCGDKIVLNLQKNEIAQEIAYMLETTGLGELNARGAGFLRTDREVREARQRC